MKADGEVVVEAPQPAQAAQPQPAKDVPVPQAARFVVDVGQAIIICRFSQ